MYLENYNLPYPFATLILTFISLTSYFIYTKIIEKRKSHKAFSNSVVRCHTRRIELSDKINRMKLILDKKISEQEAREITNTPILILLDQIKVASLSKIRVLHAFQYIAIEAHKKTNCLTDIIENAEDYITENKNGLLEGLPISFKDGIALKGCDRSLGCVRFLGLNCKSNEPVVQCLIDQGAIPFVKTNMAQLGFSFSSSNPIYGETINPLGLHKDVKFTPGGSSGGEAALISYGGSLIGIGSDMGGSVRIPSSMCGLFAMKPTSLRWNYRGFNNSYSSQNMIRTVRGPMAKSFDGLFLLVQSLASDTMHRLDVELPPVPFNMSLFLTDKKLKIGYFTGNEDNQVLPPMKRVVEDSVGILRSKGFDVEKWNPPHVRDCSDDYFFRIILSESGAKMKKILKDHVVDDSIKEYIDAINLPTLAKYLAPFTSYLEKCDYNKTLYRHVKGIRSYSKWRKVCQKVELMKQDVIKSWLSHNFDVVIFPAFTCPAVESKEVHKVHGACWPTMYFNVLDFPAGTMPLSKINQTDLDSIRSFETDNTALKMLKEMCSNSLNFPLNIQIAALPYKEEVILSAMRHLILN